MRYLALMAALGAAGGTVADDSGLWSGDLEFGYVSTGGNTETTTLKSRADLKREVEDWRYQAHFDSLNSKEDDERSAEKYFLTNKIDYKFSGRSYMFGYASYEDDRFSGFDWQAVLAAGYGYRLLENDTMTWDAEVGPGYRISNVEDTSTGDDNEHEVILRAYTKYQWKLSDTATFEQELSAESGADNTISRSVTSLKTAIIAQLAMKLSYTIKYTEAVPAENKHMDTETAVTLVYAF
jgi:putative salt-induced outer membrane protein YdiY